LAGSFSFSATVKERVSWATLRRNQLEPPSKTYGVGIPILCRVTLCPCGPVLHRGTCGSFNLPFAGRAPPGTDKSCGYCLEMICADFLAGVNLENDDPTILLKSMSRFFKFLPGEQRQAFCARSDGEGFFHRIPLKRTRVQLDPEIYERLRKQVLHRDGWTCRSAERNRI
jgi:hypothetical protein